MQLLVWVVAMLLDCESNANRTLNYNSYHIWCPMAFAVANIQVTEKTLTVGSDPL
jgi:hypothetical protein